MTNHRGITPESVQQARHQLDQMTGEIPSSDGGGGKGGHSDRTGSLAFRDRIDPEDDKRGHLADVALNATRRIDELMTTIINRGRKGQPVARQVAQLDALLSAWEPLNTWSIQNLQARTVGAGDAGCVDCALVPDSLGRPLFNPKHPGLRRCRRCHTALARVRARDGHEDDETCPRVVILWRERNAGRDIRDHILDGLLSGRIQP